MIHASGGCAIAAAGRANRSMYQDDHALFASMYYRKMENVRFLVQQFPKKSEILVFFFEIIIIFSTPLLLYLYERLKYVLNMFYILVLHVLRA